MSPATILNRTKLVNREVFDPSKRDHVLSLMKFIETGNWGSVQFFEETPYTDVPATVMNKYLRHAFCLQKEASKSETVDNFQKLPLLVPGDTK
jgi:hypothetical protein